MEEVGERRGEKNREASSERKEGGKKIKKEKKKCTCNSLQNTWNTKQLLRKKWEEQMKNKAFSQF